MWKCSACQNENKDEYRYCLSCGNPRPDRSAKQAQEKQDRARANRKAGVVTVILLLLSLLLIAAIIFMIVFFPRLSGQIDEDGEDRQSSSSSHRSRQNDGEDDSENGGISSFVFGGDTDTQSRNDPTGASAVPEAAATPLITPLPTAEPTPAPTPSTTVAPIADEDYLIPGSNSRYITEDDLKDLSWEQCCLARNEIFARHGRIFVTPEIAAYFSAKTWYHGTVSAAAFSESVLNEFEKANVSFISQYESKHWGGSYY